jgi:7-cyano-7-deazaguanine synthase in queuosine biosynthesis
MTKVYVRRGGSRTGGCSVILQPAANLQAGQNKFKALFGGLTTLEADLLLIASTIFAVDRCITRGEREDLVRTIQVSLPVANIGRFQPKLPLLEELLRTLSYDNWHIDLRHEGGKPEEDFNPKPASGNTLLFSGGLDSLAAAIEFGAAGEPLQLVSHTTRSQRMSVVQDELVSDLRTIGIRSPHRKFQVSAVSKWPAAHLSFDAESSQRTRSFLFLTLGILCARRAGHSKVIYIAENGQLAIHLPLTQARIGAFSTRTAHPEVLAKAQQFFDEILGLEIQIINPYVHKTKGEVTKIVWDRLPESVATTVSCWKTSRLTGDATHCGICAPCIIRRIAIETCGPDPTKYERDLFTERFAELPEDDDGRRNLADYGEFVLRVEQYSEMQMMDEWPELYSSEITCSDVIQMYRRATVEARSVLSRYPNVARVLR